MRWGAVGAALLLLGAAAHSFVLEGSQTSFAQFRKWNAALNGTLEFEFKTENANGLLLYTDDGGTYDFFEIKLVEGALRLRYNLGGGAQIITVGRDLHDGHWHKVKVRRDGERTSLTVDAVTQERTSRGKEFFFGRLASNSDVYVGGMPAWYSSKLTLLALPSVIFEPRFGGAIRNLVYADEEVVVPRRQEMKMNDHKCGGYQHCAGLALHARGKKARGLRGNLTDACEEHDPCQHGGICISTDSGPICECRNLDYEGIFCEKDKAPSEATFRGLEFLWYDLSRTGGEPIVSNQDSIALTFKTRHPTGLLFHTGDGMDYLNLALKEGGVILSMSLANGKLDLHVKPNKVRFDDNQWHKVTVHRKIQEISAVTSFCRVSLVVDGVYTEHSSTAGTFTMLSSSRVYIAGSENTHALPGSRIHNNFIGCLRKVEFSTETLRLNLVELARTGNKLIAVAGHVDFICQEVDAADPITFTTMASHLVLPNWDATRTGSISLKIRTIEPNGLIMYSIGSRNFHADMFALELMSGHLYLHLDLGSGEVKVKATMRRIDDGMWHELSLRRNGKEGRLTVDGNTADFSTPGDSIQLDLEGGLYVGGLGPLHTQVPPALWSGVLQQGYVGCMRDLVVNGDALDIADYARQQDSGSIQPACHRLGPQCDSQPCMNSGSCSEGWNRFICDCTSSSFTGPTCGKEATTLSYNGSQYMAIHLVDVMRTQTEDITFRFRTKRPIGLLLSTRSEQSSDRLQIMLDSGRVKMIIRIGDKEKTMTAGQGLNDNQWHTVIFSRRASNLNLQVDDEVPTRVETVLGKQSTLELQYLHVGGFPHNEDAMTLGSGHSNVGMSIQPASFVGSMQQFTFNGQHYIEMARAAVGTPGQKGSYFRPQIYVTANFSKRDNQLVHNPVTFKSKHTFVGLPVLKAYSSTNIYFQFKTRESSGLLLYNAGREQDFLAIELVNGHLQYIFNLGDGPVRVRDNARSSLNDNRWHAVTIGRPSPKQHTLMVDDNFAIITSLGHNEKLDLAGILYLGGVPKDLPLPKQIQSKHGFEGCLASLDLNGESPNVMVDALIPSSLVSSGCDGHNTKCSHNICENRGVCVQQWNSYTCDCDMTSYTGTTCSEESKSCEFGPNRGIITYVFPEDRRPEMKSDVLALGFITTKEDAVLLRVDSGTSNDYMELEIVEGNIFMVYNMGTNDHPIGEISIKVSDNQYHVVRFTRSGANSTIQVDDYNVQTNHPAGHQLTVFNSQAQIQIGGKWNRAKQKVERAFTGVMSGLVLNGLRLLDLAAERDPRTEVRGDVTFLTSMRDRLHDPLQRMQQTPSSGFPGVMDDLVFSGAGSGCNADDEDQCTPLFESSVAPGDDLITPVYVPPTRPPQIVTTSQGQGSKPCDDEEDCFTGSGSGEVTSTPDETGVTTNIHKEVSTIPGAGHTSHIPSQPEVGGSETGSSTTIDAATSDLPPSSSISSSSSSSSSGSSSMPSSPIFSIESSPSTRLEVMVTTPATTTTTIVTYHKAPPPLPPIFPTPYIPRDRDRISSESAENTAFIIGLIAGTMILIILIILLVLKFKNRSHTAYKVDERKSFNAESQRQSAALLGGANQSPPTPQAVNGNVRNGNGKAKKRELKDIKEWYV